jgi:YVTN family beta-propeller protein
MRRILRMLRIVLSWGCLAVGAAPWLVAQQATPSPALLVLSKADHLLSIVDPATLVVVARVPSGPDPHEVIASTDGARAYISNYGNGAYNTITVVDLLRQTALPAIDLGALWGPHGLDFAAGKLWFTAEAAMAIGRVDPATGAIDLILGTGQNRTHMLAVSSDGKRVVTTNVNSGTVSILEQASGQGGRGPPGRGGPPGRRGGPPPRALDVPASRGPAPVPPPDWDATVVRVGNGAEGFDISPDAKEAWVANAQDGTISVIDLATKRVTQTIAAGVTGANRLKFTPDGTMALVSTLSGSNVTVLSVATRAVAKRIPVGHGSAGILMQPDGARAFVACTPDGNVAVVDMKSLAVTGHVSGGNQPDGLAWAVRRSLDRR